MNLDHSHAFGTITFTARTEVDKVNRVVTLADFKLTKVDFPTASDSGATYSNTIQQVAPGLLKTISLDRLHADLAINQAEQKAARYQLRNEPPKIIYSTAPAILIPIDGSAVLRPVSGEKDIQRVINTSALMLFDQWRSPGSNTEHLDGFRQSRSLGENRANSFHPGGSGFHSGFGGFHGGFGGGSRGGEGGGGHHH